MQCCLSIVSKSNFILVMGEGKTPGFSHIRALGEVAGVRKVKVDDIVDQTRTALSDWPSLAKEYGVKASNIRLIAGRISEVVR